MPKKKIPSVGQVPQAGSVALPDSREEEFCQLYSMHRNGARAYRNAFKTQGWKTTSLRSAAWKMVTKDYIATRIAFLESQCLQLVQVSRERLLAELAEIATAPVHKNAKIDYWAKMRATELLGQMSGAFKNAEGTGSGNSGPRSEDERRGLREALRRKAG